jgi:uncharacterized membrane protein YfcA
MLFVAVPVGLLIGLTMGALGGGGSILTVPVLVFLLGMDPAAATTGSLIIVGITAAVAMLAAYRQGRVKIAQGAVFGLLGAGGAVAGTTLSLAVAPAVLMTAFAGLMLTVGALMLVRGRTPARVGAPDQDEPVPFDVPIITFNPRFVCACPRAAKVLVAALLVGVVTGFFGVGGGFLVVPALVLALDFPMTTAVGTSLLVIAINSGVSLAVRVPAIGAEIDWVLIGVFTAASVVGGLVGGRLAARARPDLLRTGFAALVVVVGLGTAAVSITQLT